MEHRTSALTPAQAADVINYYRTHENEPSKRNGWRDKVPLGQAACHTIQVKHSILPDQTPLLTAVEVADGQTYIERVTAKGAAWPIEPTNEQWEQIEHLSDTQPCSIKDAYIAIMQ